MLDKKLYFYPAAVQRSCLESPKYQIAQAEYNRYYGLIGIIKNNFNSYINGITPLPAPKTTYDCTLIDKIYIAGEDCPPHYHPISNMIVDGTNVTECLGIIKDVTINLACPLGNCEFNA